MKPALLVVSYGSHALVEASLSRTMVPDGGFVVVVDNFTTVEERSAMRALSRRKRWHLIEPASNLGFGGGMNAAALHAIENGATSLVLLNPDAFIEEDGMERLSSRVEAQRDVLLSPLVLRPDGHHFSSLMEVDLTTGAVRRLRSERPFDRSAVWVSGACMALSVELWEKVGGFDDDYFLYWEDVDLSFTVAAAGGTIAVDEEVRVVHDAGGTQTETAGTRAKSPTYYYFNTRNRLVFAAKHIGPNEIGNWQRRSIKAAYAILVRGGRRQFLRPASSIVPALRGTLAGLRYVRASRRGGGA